MNLRGQYIEISSEEEMEKASKWLESLGYKNLHDKKYDTNGTYLFISNDLFHFNNESKNSYWRPFSVLYDEGMPREEEDLLSKAKRLYPIGTQYKCAAGDYNVYTVESMNWSKASDGINEIYGEDGKGCIYKHGKWAEIVDEVKPIEKWSVGSYVVFLIDNLQGNFFKKGELARIYRSEPDDYRIWYSNQNTNNYDSDFVIENIKWFATLEEAEVFSKSLQPTIKEEWKPQVGDWVVTDNLSNGMGGMYNGNIRGEDGKGILYREGKWAEIIEPPKAEVYNPGYIYNEATETYKVDKPYPGLELTETHQSINKSGKQFSPVKVELIKIKKLKK